MGVVYDAVDDRRLERPLASKVIRQETVDTPVARERFWREARLKPSNVFLTRHGIKLLDFGLARPFVDEVGATRRPLTEPGLIVGTPKYIRDRSAGAHLKHPRSPPVRLCEWFRCLEPTGMGSDSGRRLVAVIRRGSASSPAT
jgi:hypothetical protein